MGTELDGEPYERIRRNSTNETKLCVELISVIIHLYSGDVRYCCFIRGGVDFCVSEFVNQSSVCQNEWVFVI